MKWIYRIEFFFFTLVMHSILHAHTTSRETHIDTITTQITISFPLAPQELIYKDFINISVDHPAVDLSPCEYSIDSVQQYVPTLRATKQVYDKPFIIKCTATNTGDKPINNAHIHLTYATSQQKQIIEELIPLTFAQQQSPVASEQTICSPQAEPLVTTPPKTLSISLWSGYLETLIRTTDLLWVKILLIMLLGLLMSFTPCIYPMIPITIGIMQGQAKKSVAHSFLHALAYTIGIATTYAVLGLFAALSGTIFGMFLTSPFVVCIIVAMLIYLAGSMFGFYELYIPAILKERSDHKYTPSAFSAFLFGALSGTIASPCLSPGLALVLCIVSSLGNPFLGFLLLFAFGVGLSIPLLIIGTFSSSLTMLRPGIWMIEIKKIFGFLLLGMSFYYLKNMVPLYIVLWLFATFIAAVGVYYLYTISDHDSRIFKRIKSILGILLLASAVDLFVEAYQATYPPQQEAPDTFWLTDYDQALTQARQQNKLLFIDFWAPSCSICTAIDKTLMKDMQVRRALNQFIPVKIELIMTDPAIARLKEKCKIMGLPTFVLVDPTSETVIKRWGGELYHMEKEEFIKQLLS